MPDDLTRRGLLGAGAAAGAAAALPAGAGAAPRKRVRRRADVLVVGAGLAGLHAAERIVAQGRSVVVLEARKRVGGRVLNHDIGGGEVVEIGGQWIGPTQDVLAALAKDVGVDTFKVYNEGDYLYVRGGTKLPYKSSGPLGPVPPDPLGAAEAFAAIQQLNGMAAELDVARPWAHPRAAEWDGQTFETWKLANAQTPSGRFLLDLGIEAVWAAEPRDVSLLHVLFYIRAATNGTAPVDFQRLLNTAGGAQESRFVGGSQRVAVAMAARLGRRVILGAAVRRVIQRRGGVEVLTDADRFVARQVIVTAPPAVSASIDYHPPLPADRAQLLQRFPQGNAIKCQAIYDRPFWRAEGLAGQVTSDADPIGITFDNSPPDGSPGVLLGFIEGQHARVWARRSAADRRAAVLGNFAAFFGEEARRPRDYVEMDWSSEPWTRGCYVGFTPPGVLLDYGEAIRRPFGRLKWAGAESATLWNGYMEGALRSGARAADEALADL